MLTVVTGPPCSGKTTHAQTHAKPGDIVIDYDHIAQALGSPDTHDHPSAIAYVTEAARRAAIRAAIGCHRRGARVWVIDTEPTDQRRHQYNQAGADIITITADPAELHRRASQSRPKRWHAVIDQWFADHGSDEAPRPRLRGIRSW